MSDKLKERVLVVSPMGTDARNVCALLEREGIPAVECADLAVLAEKVEEGGGAALIAEEAFRRGGVKSFVGLLSTQPSWSDLPILIVTRGGDALDNSHRAVALLGTEANVTFLEKPFRSSTLLSAVKSALRSRHRQYQVRDLVQNLEEKVAERTLRLEQTISELEAFSYSVSHDLRAPLRAMQGYAHVLLEDHKDKLDPNGLDYLQRIIASSNRLDQLVMDLLTYSRAARGQFHFEKVDLQNLVSDIIQQYPTFQLPSAEVRLDGPLLPVRGHEASLAQCVSNLLGNAVKFRRPGIVPVVDVSTENGNGRVKVLFKDNGIGVSAENQQRIFQMFERGAHSSNYEGTGIGLAIVKKAVERMGGSVGVQANHDFGSTFWFELPAP